MPAPTILSEILANRSVIVSGVEFSWRGFGFDAENHRFARFLCFQCFREELKDSPERLVERMADHAARCSGKLCLVESEGA